MLYFFFFFFNDTATPEIYPLSLPDALPIFSDPGRRGGLRRRRSWHRQRPRGGSGRGARVSVAGGFAGGSVSGFVGAVGNTPLIRLKGVSEETGCEILGKAEFMNPRGSVKDRAASANVLGAQSRGELPPGGTVVEGTAGNTGIDRKSVV